MTTFKEIYVVVAEPWVDTPQSYDGEWVDIIGCFSEEEDAERVADRARKSGTWGTFMFEGDPQYDVDNPSSSRGFVITIKPAELLLK